MADKKPAAPEGPQSLRALAEAIGVSSEVLTAEAMAILAAGDAIRPRLGTLVGLGHSPYSIAAALAMIAGEVAEQLNIPAEDGENAAITYFRGGRRRFAAAQAQALALQNGGQLNG